MPALPRYTSPKENSQLSASMVGDLQMQIQSLYNQDSPDGFVAEIGPFGTRVIDQRKYGFWAQITGDGSGSGGGSGGVSDSVLNHYDWMEMMPVFVDGVYQLIEKPFGRKGTSEYFPAVEVNELADVPVGANVWLEPGVGVPDHYLFTFGGSIGSGSGNSIPAYCDGELSGYITIDGDSVSFESI